MAATETRPSSNQLVRIDQVPVARSPQALVAGTIQKPALVVDAAARKWDEIVSAAPADFFAPVDADALGAYCIAWVFYSKAVMSLATEGLTAKNARGQIVAHPMVSVKRQQEQTMQALGDRLGLSPAARTGRTSSGWWSAGKSR